MLNFNEQDKLAEHFIEVMTQQNYSPIEAIGVASVIQTKMQDILNVPKIKRGETPISVLFQEDAL